MLVTRKFYKRLALLSILTGLGILSYCVYLSVKTVNLQEMCTVHRIGIVDGVLLKKQAKCFAVHQETARMLNDIFTQVRNSEQQIKAEYEQVQNNKNLTQKQKKQKKINIEKKWKTVSGDYNRQIEDIRILDSKLMNYINNTLDQVFAEISLKLNLILIMNKGAKDIINVFYNVPRLDITEKVINALDTKLADFSIKSVS